MKYDELDEFVDKRVFLKELSDTNLSIEFIDDFALLLVNWNGYSHNRRAQ